MISLLISSIVIELNKYQTALYYFFLLFWYNNTEIKQFVLILDSIFINYTLIYGSILCWCHEEDALPHSKGTVNAGNYLTNAPRKAVLAPPLVPTYFYATMYYTSKSIACAIFPNHVLYKEIRHYLDIIIQFTMLPQKIYY